jgi:peptidoglycan/LPS O-acetylase OafA/YrhL
MTARIRLPYVPALDGVRAIAIIAVMLYHGGLAWLPGGFLGVDIFFVLSGFLITSLLINEYRASGRIDIGAFYRSRVRRLVPALLVMVFVVFTYATLSMKDTVAATLRDLPWAMSGLSNWWFVFHQQDYFESIGRPGLLQHTWSLAVEAQFYLIWPLLLIAILPAFGLKVVRYLSLACAFGSGAVMLFLASHFDGVSNMSHVYFGTDTHSMGLFLGATLATVWQPASAKAGIRSNAYLGLSVMVGGLALALIVMMFLKVNEYTGEFYMVGFPLTAGLAVFLIGVATHPELSVGRALAVAPLRWIGERSYGMYLWHWPIFQATRPGIDLALTGVPALLLRIALTALVAELSYRYVEMPVRRGALGRLWQRVRGWSPVAFSCATASAIACILGLAALETVLTTNAVRASAAALAPLKVVATAGTHRRRHAGSKTRRGRRHGAVQAPALLVGDSVLLGVSEFIAHRVNVVKVDAVVARQAISTRDVIARDAEAGALQPTTIVNLGNNGTVDEPTLRAILDSLRHCKQVVVVNARVPRPWQDDNDALMARVVPAYDNAVLADWYAASAGHPEYFAPDGVHPRGEGALAYAQLVASAVEWSAQKSAARQAYWKTWHVVSLL